MNLTSLFIVIGLQLSSHFAAVAQVVRAVDLIVTEFPYGPTTTYFSCNQRVAGSTPARSSKMKRGQDRHTTSFRATVCKIVPVCQLPHNY